MICAQCKATVPNESTFCLQCGYRLMPVERLAPVNGGKGSRPGAPALIIPAATTAMAGSPRPAPGAGGREAYALSFQPLPDERLRYRVARWVCEVAPAHQLSEVQERLSGGGFATFLALTPAEAEAARQRIQALGAHPALWQLKPATVAEMLLPARERPAKVEWSPQKKFAAVAVGLLIFFIFALVSWNRYMAVTSRPATPHTGVPTIESKP
jgi:hypothetical protein